MDFRILITRFRQFGGMRLVWEYAKLGALWPAVKAGVRCFVKGDISSGAEESGANFSGKV